MLICESLGPTGIVDGRARTSYGRRKPLEEGEVLLKQHHDGYTDWAEFERNPKHLAVNAYGKLGGTRSGCDGPVLVQTGAQPARKTGRILVNPASYAAFASVTEKLLWFSSQFWHAMP